MLLFLFLLVSAFVGAIALQMIFVGTWSGIKNFCKGNAFWLLVGVAVCFVLALHSERNLERASQNESAVVSETRSDNGSVFVNLD